MDAGDDGRARRRDHYSEVKGRRLETPTTSSRPPASFSATKRRNGRALSRPRACSLSVLPGHPAGCRRRATLARCAGLGDGAARTSRRVGRGPTCSVSDYAGHNHNGNGTGNHAASAPFPIPRIIWVPDGLVVGVSVSHGDLLTQHPRKQTQVVICCSCDPVLLIGNAHGSSRLRATWQHIVPAMMSGQHQLPPCSARTARRRLMRCNTRLWS